MESRFDSQFFASNRRRLKELFTGTAPIVVSANGLLQRGADSSYAFAQDANFWYLTGIDSPDILLVMDRDKEYLIVPERSINRQIFDGDIMYSDLQQSSGIQSVYDEKRGWELLASRLQKVKYAATLAVPPVYSADHGLYTNPARVELVRRLKSLKSDLELLDLNPHLARLRMIKQPVELLAIQSAIDITIASMKDALRSGKLRSYSHEFQLEAEISRGIRFRGATGHAFDPIVAGGSRACTLHNVANNSAFNLYELVIVDVGAEVEHYAADITRTINLQPPSRRQRSVHNAVLQTQSYAISLLGPGTLLRDYEQQVEQYIGEKLRELGLIKSINHENVRKYYPHSTSHFLGLNAHDAGDYDRPLEAGTVLTVEPGIYIRDENLGVRIEDDILITNEGITILTDKLPRELS